MNPRIVQWEFFMEALSADHDNCINWPFGKMGAGYPSIKDMNSGNVVGGHRLACIMAHGEPNKKMHAAHICGNPSCINPRHLRWATAKENAADKKMHGTNNSGERHGLSALTNDEAQDIVMRLSNKKRGDQASLAREYGVSPMTISRLARGHSYCEVH